MNSNINSKNISKNISKNHKKLTEILILIFVGIIVVGILIWLFAVPHYKNCSEDPTCKFHFKGKLKHHSQCKDSCVKDTNPILKDSKKPTTSNIDSNCGWIKQHFEQLKYGSWTNSCPEQNCQVSDEGKYCGGGNITESSWKCENGKWKTMTDSEKSQIKNLPTLQQKCFGNSINSFWNTQLFYPADEYGNCGLNYGILTSEGKTKLCVASGFTPGRNTSGKYIPLDTEGANSLFNLSESKIDSINKLGLNENQPITSEQCESIGKIINGPVYYCDDKNCNSSSGDAQYKNDFGFCENCPENLLL